MIIDNNGNLTLSPEDVPYGTAYESVRMFARQRGTWTVEDQKAYKAWMAHHDEAMFIQHGQGMVCCHCGEPVNPHDARWRFCGEKWMHQCPDEINKMHLRWDAVTPEKLKEIRDAEAYYAKKYGVNNNVC